MKYRISSLTVKRKSISPRRLRAAGRERSLCVLPPIPYECPEDTSRSIPIDLLFAVSELPAPPSVPLGTRLWNRINAFVRRAVERLAALLKLIWETVLSAVRRRLESPSYNPFYAGTLLAAICVCILSASAAALWLFAPYLAPYKTLTLPELSGAYLSEAEESYGELLTLLVSYENSEDVPAGAIISQSPSSGVTRRIYKRGVPPTLSLKVSLGRKYYEVTDLVSRDEQTARLALMNEGVPFTTVYEYSDTIPKGEVISTVPSAGKKVFSGETLTLTVSLGKKLLDVRVPDLYGLTEAQADALLSQLGLTLGGVSYESASAPAGTVIQQSSAPYSRLAEGSSVNITVSLGIAAPTRYVPDLYGLTVEQAADRLSSVGLVVGGIFSVSAPAPKGTVIIQGIAPGTPIEPSLTSVDLYISS